MTQLVHYEGGAEKNKVCVAVRFRPLRCAQRAVREGRAGAWLSLFSCRKACIHMTKSGKYFLAYC